MANYLSTGSLGDICKFIDRQNGNDVQPSLESKKRKLSTDAKTQSANEIAQATFKEFQKLAYNGDVNALRKVGKMYLEGKGTIASKYLAFIYLKKAAQKGNPTAQFQVAQMYEKGTGTMRSQNNALLYYKMAADNGIIEASQALALKEKRVIKTTQTEDSTNLREKKYFCYIKTLADKFNDSIAQEEVGFMYGEGFGTEKSLKKSFEYYKKSADQGYLKAQHEVANMYRHGVGTKQNPQHAYKYYDIVITCDKDNIKAIEDRDSLIRESHPDYDAFLSKQNLPNDLLALAKIHQQMAGRFYVSTEAMNLYDKAANEYNDKDAWYALAKIYGVDKRQWCKAHAQTCLKKAASLNHEKAQLILEEAFYDKVK